MFDSATLYAALRAAHIGLVIASVSLFAVRGLGVLLSAAWPMRPRLRHLSEGIDTLLLLAGATLWWWLQHNPLREPWFMTKLLLLPLYVLLGIFALKRARTRAARAGCYAAALAVVGLMALSATTRAPLGLASLAG